MLPEAETFTAQRITIEQGLGGFFGPQVRASTKSMLCHRKTAYAVFRSFAPRFFAPRKRGFRAAMQALLALSPSSMGAQETSISCKMAFPSETLILRPEIDSGSGFQPLLGDVHAVACG